MQNYKSINGQMEKRELMNGQSVSKKLAVVQSDKVCIDNVMIEPTSVMTGDKDINRYLYYQLKISMMKADNIDMIVSFLMESGVRMILKDLKAALDRGVKVRILTGNYLGITQPSALYLIKKELGGRIDLRFYSDRERSRSEERRVGKECRL